MKTSVKRQGQLRRFYEICEDTREGTFQPMGFMSSDKQEALADLEMTQQRYPRAYLATVTYRRCERPRVARKG